MNNKQKANELVRIVLDRQAIKDGVKLPLRFWDERAWKPKYTFQITLAHSLLKNYDYEAIRKALESYKGKNILSLKAPWLDELIEAEQKKIDLNKEFKKLKLEENKENNQESVNNENKTFKKPKDDLFSKLE